MIRPSRALVMLTTVITEATPMMMPSIVRAVRSLPVLRRPMRSFRRTHLDRAGAGAAIARGVVHVLDIGLRQHVFARRHRAHHIGDREHRLVVGGAVDRGAYIVQGVTKSGGPAVFHVTAQSADLKKTLKIQKTRTWVAPKTLGDVLNQVASDNALTPAIDGGLAAIAERFDDILAEARTVSAAGRDNATALHALTETLGKLQG